MKKSILWSLVALLSSSPGFSQVPDITAFQGIIENFSNSIAPVLPMNAAIGSTWSDAYIGSILGVPPHLGLGLTTGVAFIPSKGLNTLISTVSPGTNLPAALDGLGVPLPAAVVDGRIGGIFLPFDVGFKVGFLAQAVKDMVASTAKGYSMDYQMFGADIRYALIQENLVMPGVSIGVGFTQLNGFVAMNPFAGDVRFGGIPYVNDNGTPGDTTDDTIPTDGKLVFTNPQLKLEWKSSVIDLKAQVSKNLLILTPYAGLGASVGISEAGGGLNTTVKILDGSDVELYTGQAAIDALADAKAKAAASGSPFPDLPTITADGIKVLKAVNGWAYRIYGGTSVNLAFFHLDLQGMYNLATQSLGVTVGARIQL